jgi:hypothetical protein
LKARARALRWTEELILLREEMHRVLRFLDAKADWWIVLANEYNISPSHAHSVPPTSSARKSSPSFSTVTSRSVPKDLNEGLCAYAYKQANVYRKLGEHFASMWTQSQSQIDNHFLAHTDDGFVKESVVVAWYAIYSLYL